MDNDTLSTITTLSGIVLIAAIWLLRPIVLLRLLNYRPGLALKMSSYKLAYTIFAIFATIAILSAGRYINIKLKGGTDFVKGVSREEKDY
jgi:hypothetical protein